MAVVVVVVVVVVVDGGQIILVEQGAGAGAVVRTALFAGVIAVGGGHVAVPASASASESGCSLAVLVEGGRRIDFVGRI